jgi:hypothetical protein
MEEIFEEGYHTSDERAQKRKRERWQYMKDLHTSWDKEMRLGGLRELHAKI